MKFSIINYKEEVFNYKHTNGRISINNNVHALNGLTKAFVRIFSFKIFLGPKIRPVQMPAKSDTFRI
jgi:hypothetical protein